MTTGKSWTVAVMAFLIAAVTIPLALFLVLGTGSQKADEPLQPLAEVNS